MPVPVRARVGHAEPGAAARLPEVQERELGPGKVVRAWEEEEVTRAAVASDGGGGGDAMRSVELCAGAGGLALATTQAGFAPLALLESDPVACETTTGNQQRGCQWVKTWPDVSPVDIRDFDYSSLTPGPVDLLSGGPPCQPFSVAGKHLGIDDDRDLFAEVARAMASLRPRAILIENTNGLARSNFQRQLRYICLQLTFPEERRVAGEHWETSLDRLERLAAAKPRGLRYAVSCAVLNAADYGGPQQRERLIIAGFRDGEGLPFAPPPATHSLDALLHDQWVTGEYWDRHKVSSRRRPKPPEKWKGRIDRLKDGKKPVGVRPWVTARDALVSLPEPVESDDGDFPNHRLQPGARAYPRHTGSCYDLPAKALKAGRHGVPGGENMLAYPDGAVRYFTIRECARLQTFPDDYFFSGSWRAMTRQLGNPVRQSCRVKDGHTLY